FGRIVGSYKGNVDQYYGELQAVSQSPICAASEKTPLGDKQPFDNPACGQLDLDFGASPNVFTVGGNTCRRAAEVRRLPRSPHLEHGTTMDRTGWSAMWRMQRRLHSERAERDLRRGVTRRGRLRPRSGRRQPPVGHTERQRGALLLDI